MLARDLFWFATGLATALAGALVALPLLRHRSTEARAASRAPIAVAVAAFASIAVGIVGLYLWLGTPAALEPASAARAFPPGGTAQTPPTPSSMEEAAARLAARLDAGGGTRGDWLLLAQSYDFLGRDEDAAAARQQAAAAPDGGAVEAPALGLDDQRQLAQADELARQRDLKGAIALYADLAGRGALTADGWANYADALATDRGRKLSGEPARFIAEALKLDPAHPKALWLQASLAYEEKRYADAVQAWTALREALPANSTDQGIVAANLAESARLAGIPVPSASPTTAPARIEGLVEVAPGLRDRAGAGATLFIYAKQTGAAGPPFAVLRLDAGAWPVRFVLDDSNAMVPGRNLSSAGEVVLEARISRSGNATPQPGDLVGTVPSVSPRAGEPVRIAIDRVIG